jgi:FkbM family methyltransferase
MKSTEIDWRQRANELSDRVSRLRHGILEKEVLQGTLPLRARTLEHRSRLPEVRERERRFRDTSPAYAAALDDRTALAGMQRITVDGLPWWVPLMRPDDPALVERALRHQDFPYRVIAQTRELAIGGAMIDVGANVGRMSIPRVILGDATLAYCAEPDPLNYACLVRNVRDNRLAGLVLAERIAIGSENGTVRFERSKTAGGHRVIDADRMTRNETIEVPALTLDTWVDRAAIDLEQVTFVKVDAQGSEVRILRGASRVLAHRHVSWQIEVDPMLLGKGHSGPPELFALIQAHFTHFIDLSRHVTGPRLRSTAELGEALAYIGESPDGRTDILVCTLEKAASSHRHAVPGKSASSRVEPSGGATL